MDTDIATLLVRTASHRQIALLVFSIGGGSGSGGGGRRRVGGLELLVGVIDEIFLVRHVGGSCYNGTGFLKNSNGRGASLAKATGSLELEVEIEEADLGKLEQSNWVVRIYHKNPFSNPSVMN